MALSFSKTKKALLGSLAALTLGGAMLASTGPAEAQWRGGWHRGGWHGGAWRGGWGHRHWGYRPAYWGHRRHHWGGGAVAAGLVGGLALGALAARPPYYYGYGYPYYGAAYVPVTYGGDCWVERRVRINRWGERVVRRIQVCG